MRNEKIALAIVDDHQIVIDGLKSLLHGHERFTVTAETNSPQAMLKLLAQHEIDILLTDVMMPEMDGPQLAKEVRQRFPDIRIIALSMSGQGDVVNRMIEEADIAGYVLKNTGKAELIGALEKVAGGGIYFSEEVLEEMTRASRIRQQNEEAHLTAREIEIVKLIEKEMSNKEIAGQLFLSERTVETHRKNIFRKTKTNSVIGLIKYAYEHKLI
jgi:DNA-binding NarL/FixJ family response regulator